MKLPSEKLDKYTIKYIYKDSEGFRLTTKDIEKLLKESKIVNKKPKLIIDIPRNEKERIVLEIFISIKRKGQ
jgi:hypothetical protein